jgi:dihydrofolate reductase
MGRILIHEFISLDGVIESPSWTFDYGFDPQMGEELAEITGKSKAILLGRTTYEMNNTTILGGYDAERIRALKDEVGGDIYVSGSAKLVRGLLADGLADELHLFLYPVALGKGDKLFLDREGPTMLALAGTRAYDNGVVRLSYRAA